MCWAFPVKFAEDCVGEAAEKSRCGSQTGRSAVAGKPAFPSGRGKKGDEGFAKQLAALADIYVNDAFGTAHPRTYFDRYRPAKIHGANTCFRAVDGKGSGVDKEGTGENGEHPVTAILGGSKVSSKLPIIYKMLESVDNLIIGGGMAYTFIKAMGGKIGDSLQEPEYMRDFVGDIGKGQTAQGECVSYKRCCYNAGSFSDKVPVKVFPANAIEDGWGLWT